MHWRDEDPGLPITFGPCSNGEYDPQPLSPVVKETIRRARDDCERNAKRVGMTRREFLLSACGAATTLLALDACTKEAARSSPSSSAPGGTFSLPPESTTETSAANAAIGGEEFVFDVQGHLLEYALDPATRGETYFGEVFPQMECGEVDPRGCFSINHFLEDMFLRSDTSMVVISALPIAPAGSPLSIEIMDETRRLVEALCHDKRVLMHAQALPNVGPLQGNLDAMAATVASHPVAAWKVFTNYPDLYQHDGNAWWLDDHEPGAALVGEAFIRQAVKLGVPTICAHKGLSVGSRFGSPVDFGPAAKKHPDANFVAYHSGYDAGVPEGPYDKATATGTNRLITSMLESGIGPNQNVYAELGTTWWSVMSSPTEAAHLLGKLLKYVGEDNVLWGTDCIFYGSPQDQIQALRAFEITAELQERYGYPALTKERKAKILGRNGARLYKVNPVTTHCQFTRTELEQVRRTLPGANTTNGPTTRSRVRAFVEAHKGWP